MSITTLEEYVANKNRWAALFNGKQLSLLKAKDRQAIADSIDADLSPENLTCDGELSRYQVQAKHRYLTRAAQELLSIDPNVTMYEFGV